MGQPMTQRRPRSSVSLSAFLLASVLWTALSAGAAGCVAASAGEPAATQADDLASYRAAASGTPRAEDRRLAVGGGQVCRALPEGTLKCWGRNDQGQLGLGDTANRGDHQGQMGAGLRVTSMGSNRTVRTLAAGGMSWSCAVLDDGSLKCWGTTPLVTQGNTPATTGDGIKAFNLGTGRTATSVALGWDHACVILDDGSVKCFGSNNYGQLGVGNTTGVYSTSQMGDNLPVVQIGTGARAAALALGSGFSCALLQGGSVKCWGNNGYGQLGIGSGGNRGATPSDMGDNLPAVALGTGRKAVAIATGDAHACALLDDGTVKCWGQGSYGQLGNGTTYSVGTGIAQMGDNLQVSPLPAGRRANAVTAGQSHTCVLLDDSSVRCWGAGSSGQLGRGDQTSIGTSPSQMGDALVAVPLGTGRSAVAIASGTNSATTCAVLDDGSVRCWGDNQYGQLGLGDTQNRGDNPNELGDFEPPVALRRVVVSGESHTCELFEDATVKCWGNNDFGQLGLGDVVKRGLQSNQVGDSMQATPMGTGHVPVNLAAGQYHTCALLDDGSVKCWGNNSYGQLGLGDRATRGGSPTTTPDKLPTIALGTGRTAKALAAGSGHTCAVLDDDSVKCWGANFSGQLGQGDTVNRGDDPSEMGDYLHPVTLPYGHKVRTLDAGFHHNCALMDDDTLHCWGDNQYGQLGLGDTVNRGIKQADGAGLATTDLGTGRTVKGVTAGAFHTCARLDDDTIKCWGRNDFGQLGLGDSVNHGSAPNQMGNYLAAVSYAALTSPNKAVAVESGYYHTCALMADATVQCWGYNAFAQLGQGDTINRGGPLGSPLPPPPRPINLGPGRAASAIVAGGYHTCVVLGDASLTCFGDNGQGAMALGTAEPLWGDTASEMGAGLPLVHTGQGRRVASAGSILGAFQCAILDDGVTKCWGDNGYGELGVGDTVPRGKLTTDLSERFSAVSLGTGRTARAVTGGMWHACALLDNGSVKCWGYNYAGQLGQGSTTNQGDHAGSMGDALLAVNLGTGRTAQSVVAGGYSTCALLDNGQIKCWGDNAAGALGLGDKINRGTSPTQMGDSLPAVNLGSAQPVAAGVPATATALAGGLYHFCAIVNDGDVKCWGDNSYGQLGIGNTQVHGDGSVNGGMGNSLPYVALGTGRKARALAAGFRHTCALLDDGSVKCWGSSALGQLGQGNTATHGDGSASGGMGDSLPAIALGTGPTVYTNPPPPPGAGKRARAIAASANQACALLEDSSVKCWGYNGSGQLGLGDVTNRGTTIGQMGDSLPALALGTGAPAPGAPPPPPGTGKTARAISCGNQFACAVLDDGSMKCWGDNSFGQLAQGNTTTVGSAGGATGQMGDNLKPIRFGN